MNCRKRARLVISSFGEVRIGGVKAPFRCDRERGVITFVIKNRHLAERRGGDSVVSVPLVDLLEAANEE